MRDFYLLRERLSKIFDDFHTAGRVDSTVWTPVVDLYETSDEFVVTAELPEVMENDIDVRVEGNILEIKGERKFRQEGRAYHQVERSYGFFTRSFTLPADVDQDKIKAALNDGILKIRLPKKETETPRHIEII